MTIETKSLTNGGISIEIDGKSEDLPADIASAFISQMLYKMHQQAVKSGDDRPSGGAILYPHAVAVEQDRETGEPRLRLSFGKALFVISMPKGEMRKIATIITQMTDTKPS